MLFLVTLLATCLTGCSNDADSCITSKPMANGTSAKVSVQVVTKPGLDANIVGTLDVNGGLYTTPVKELGPETDLPVGTYKGVVMKTHGDLKLEYGDQSVRLTGPTTCDD